MSSAVSTSGELLGFATPDNCKKHPWKPGRAEQQEHLQKNFAALEGDFHQFQSNWHVQSRFKHDGQPSRRLTADQVSDPGSPVRAKCDGSSSETLRHSQSWKSSSGRWQRSASYAGCPPANSKQNAISLSSSVSAQRDVLSNTHRRPSFDQSMQVTTNLQPSPYLERQHSPQSESTGNVSIQNSGLNGATGSPSSDQFVSKVAALKQVYNSLSSPLERSLAGSALGTSATQHADGDCAENPLATVSCVTNLPCSMLSGFAAAAHKVSEDTSTMTCTAFPSVDAPRCHVESPCDDMSVSYTKTGMRSSNSECRVSDYAESSQVGGQPVASQPATQPLRRRLWEEPGASLPAVPGKQHSNNAAPVHGSHTNNACERLHEDIPEEILAQQACGPQHDYVADPTSASEAHAARVWRNCNLAAVTVGESIALLAQELNGEYSDISLQPGEVTDDIINGEISPSELHKARDRCKTETCTGTQLNLARATTVPAKEKEFSDEIPEHIYYDSHLSADLEVGQQDWQCLQAPVPVLYTMSAQPRSPEFNAFLARRPVNQFLQAAGSNTPSMTTVRPLSASHLPESGPSLEMLATTASPEGVSSDHEAHSISADDHVLLGSPAFKQSAAATSQPLAQASSQPSTQSNQSTPASQLNVGYRRMSDASPQALCTERLDADPTKVEVAYSPLHYQDSSEPSLPYSQQPPLEAPANQRWPRLRQPDLTAAFDSASHLCNSAQTVQAACGDGKGAVPGRRRWDIPAAQPHAASVSASAVAPDQLHGDGDMASQSLNEPSSSSSACSSVPLNVPATAHTGHSSQMTSLERTVWHDSTKGSVCVTPGASNLLCPHPPAGLPSEHTFAGPSRSRLPVEKLSRVAAAATARDLEQPALKQAPVQTAVATAAVVERSSLSFAQLGQPQQQQLRQQVQDLLLGGEVLGTTSTALEEAQPSVSPRPLCAAEKIKQLKQRRQLQWQTSIYTTTHEGEQLPKQDNSDPTAAPGGLSAHQALALATDSSAVSCQVADSKSTSHVFPPETPVRTTSALRPGVAAPAPLSISASGELNLGHGLSGDIVSIEADSARWAWWRANAAASPSPYGPGAPPSVGVLSAADSPYPADCTAEGCRRYTCDGMPTVQSELQNIQADKQRPVSAALLKLKAQSARRASVVLASHPIQRTHPESTNLLGAIDERIPDSLQSRSSAPDTVTVKDNLQQYEDRLDDEQHAPKPYLKRKTQRVPSARIDWSHVKPKTVTRLDDPSPATRQAPSKSPRPAGNRLKQQSPASPKLKKVANKWKPGGRLPVSPQADDSAGRAASRSRIPYPPDPGYEVTRVTSTYYPSGNRVLYRIDQPQPALQAHRKVGPGQNALDGAPFSDLLGHVNFLLHDLDKDKAKFGG